MLRAGTDKVTLRNILAMVKKGAVSLIGLLVCVIITWGVIGLIVRLYNGALADHLDPIFGIVVLVVCWFAFIIYRMVTAELDKD